MTGWTILKFVAASYALAITVAIVMMGAFCLPPHPVAIWVFISGAAVAGAALIVEIHR